MDEKKLRDFYLGRGNTEEQIEEAIGFVKECEVWLAGKGKAFGSASAENVKEYVNLLIKQKRNKPEVLRAIVRYSYVINNEDAHRYLISITGAAGVYDSIAERLEKVAGKEKREAVFGDLEMPPLGSSPDQYPRCTKALVERLKANLTMDEVVNTLAGNHHRIPLSAFAEKKRRFDEARTIDEFLEGEHQALVKELEEHMKAGKLWYEQEITPDVLEWVKGDQTIQNGVRVKDWIISYKIPFNPKMWLKEKDPVKKSYYACHCQLAREALLKGDDRVPEVFCYCSGGYEKLPWDIMFNEPVKVKMLESALSGGPICTFAFRIPDGKMK